MLQHRTQEAERSGPRVEHQRAALQLLREPGRGVGGRGALVVDRGMAGGQVGFVVLRERSRATGCEQQEDATGGTRVPEGGGRSVRLQADRHGLAGARHYGRDHGFGAAGFSVFVLFTHAVERQS